MEEKQLFGSLTVYRSCGAYLRRLEQFDKSIAAYSEAVRSVPDGLDVRTLTGRSQACRDAVRPQQAFADAELALMIEPNNMRAQELKARATYIMAEFEQSVLFNYRGFRRRKKPSYFREGAFQGTQTLEDCLGKNAGDVMLDFLPLIRQTEANRRDENEPFGSMHESRIPKSENKLSLTQVEVRKHNSLDRVMAMKYLGSMAYDKFFLQNLLADPRLESANANSTARLKELINVTLETLGTRQELLRSARPYYTVKHAEKSVSRYQKKFKEATLIKEREISARTAELFLRQIEKSYRSNRVKDVISQAERMQLFLDSKTLRTLPDKEHYTDRLYREVGEAYLIQHRLSYTLSERGNKRRVAFLMGLSVGRAQSFDSVIANYPFKFVDIKQATQKVMQTLQMCENSMMKCWLTYELARMLCTQKNFTLAKFYAKRCQKVAQELDSVTWWLNGCFALLGGDLQQGNSNEVKLQVEEAYEYAKRTTNSERVLSFLAKCADMAKETVATEERKTIIKRQEAIIKVLAAEQRAETEFLFRRIASLPEGRQLSVMPVKKYPPEDFSERHQLHQRGLTVIPGEEKPLLAPPRSQVLGFQLFDTQ